jgi:hypothetical protein
MKWQHPHKPGRRVRLAYCQNLHAADTLEETIAGIRGITLPLRDRLSRGRNPASAQPFGVGLYLPAAVARALAEPDGARDLARFADFLAENALDPFTYNAFPYGGFHRAGLKAGVFLPTWEEEARVEFTLAVARIAAEIARRTGGLVPPAHVSISTHSGRFGSFAADAAGETAARNCARNMARVAEELARIEDQRGIHIILSLEPEPRASAGDMVDLAGFLERAWRWGAEDLALRSGLDPERARHLMRHHLGTCLDCCHAAVEFEDDAVERWRASQGALGKLQFSSALAVPDPGRNSAGRDALLALDEPRYLHQVTGLCAGRRLRAADLPELGRALAPDTRAAAEWEGCSEWRCHFHVPVDLESVALHDRAGAPAALTTTRGAADHMLAEMLALDAWTPAELQVEIETYTWDILPGAARGAGSLVDGLEREYVHVMGELEAAGWRPE